MAHPLRWYVPGVVYEVTTRAIQERFLLRPSEEARRLVDGVLGRAQRLYPEVRLHAYAYMSNHCQLLISSESGAQQAAFVGYVNGKVARELGRLHAWRGPFWGRRARVIPILDDDAVIERLRYVLAQGVKEGLVDRPEDWPGATSTRGLLGEPIIGVRVDRDLESKARRRGKPVDAARFRSLETVTLTPIPPWARLSAAQRVRRVRAMIRDIVETTRRVRGAPALGVDAVLRQDPHGRPEAPAMGVAPQCHASTGAVRDGFRRAYRAFQDAFRAVSRAVQGAATVTRGDFPAGSMPRATWYVPVGTSWWPPWQPGAYGGHALAELEARARGLRVRQTGRVIPDVGGRG